MSFTRLYCCAQEPILTDTPAVRGLHGDVYERR